MLEYLITSKTKRDVITLLFLNPEKEFYLREMARKIAQQPSLVRAELKKLEAGGLVKSRQRGNAIFYSANASTPIYEEVRRLLLKAGGFTGILKKALAQYSEIQFAFIYGSVARGEERAKSDVDLLIVGTPPVAQFNRTIKNIEKKIDRDVNYSLYPTGEFAKKAGSGFLSHVLRGEKLMLVGDEDELKRFAERRADSKGRAGQKAGP